MPRRLDRAFNTAATDKKLTAQDATELISELKLDDKLDVEERTRLTQLLAERGDSFTPEARRLVTSFLQDGTPLTGGILPDPKLSWDTRDKAELKVPRGAQVVKDGVRFDDPKQNLLGDCFLIASLSALAWVRPEAIEQAVRDNHDGTYTVRFFQRDGNALRPFELRVDGDLATRPSGGIVYARSRDRSELWPALIEKAYAQWKGGYGEIAIGGRASDAFEAITGQKCDFYNPVRELRTEEMWKIMTKAHQEGRAMVIGSTAVPTLEGVVDNHIYSVVGLEEREGVAYVKLRNPYGNLEPSGHGKNDGIFEVDLKTFRKNFEDLFISGPRPAS